MIGGLLAGGRHELARRHDARARQPLMTGPAPDGDLGPADADIADPDTYVAGVPARHVRAGCGATIRSAGGARTTPAAAASGPSPATPTCCASAATSRRSPARAGIRLEEMDAEETAARRTMMELDPPEHTGVPAARVQAVQPPRGRTPTSRRSAPLARSVVDDALAAGPSFDFVDRIAKQLPMRMLGALLGVPDDDGPWLVERGDALLGNTDPEFTTHPVGLVDTDEFRLMPFRSPAGVELFRYAQEQAAAPARAPDRRRHQRPAGAEGRRRGAHRARVQQLLHAARRRRQRHHPLHDDRRDEGARSNGPTSWPSCATRSRTATTRSSPAPSRRSCGGASVTMHFRRTATTRHRARRPRRSAPATRSSSGSCRPTTTTPCSPTRSRSTSAASPTSTSRSG